MGAAESVPETSLYEFTVKDCNGKEVCLETYKGKVLVVVNVASKCGFTETNYTQLTELYQKYREKGCSFFWKKWSRISLMLWRNNRLLLFPICDKCDFRFSLGVTLTA